MVASPQPLNPSSLIQAGVHLAPFTTWRVGGRATWYAEPRFAEDMQTCLDWAASHSLPVTLLGGGSNLLISDQGLPGLVIHTRRYQGVQWGTAGQVHVAAGESIVKLARAAAQRGWSGLEWAVGIPGTLGGVVTMNAGAHGCSISHLIQSVVVVDEHCQQRLLTPIDLEFGYRSSIIQHRAWVVLGATLQLYPDHDPQQVMQQTQTHWERRRSTQPYDWPSCGSVFRNPLPKTAGWLIEQTGLKGYRLGGAEVAQKHANFILNKENASTHDIYQLIQHIQNQVYQRWQIQLEPEVKMLGIL